MLHPLYHGGFSSHHTTSCNFSCCNSFLHQTSLAWSPALLPFRHLKAPQPNPAATCLCSSLSSMPSHWALADTRRFLKTLHALHGSPALPARPSAELALHPISQVTQRETAHKPTAEYHPAGSDVYRTSLSCLFRLNEEQLLCKCDFSTCSLIRVAAAISF